MLFRSLDHFIDPGDTRAGDLDGDIRVGDHSPDSNEKSHNDGMDGAVDPWSAIPPSPDAAFSYLIFLELVGRDDDWLLRGVRGGLGDPTSFSCTSISTPGSYWVGSVCSGSLS